MSRLTVERVAVRQWRDRVDAVLGAGARFAGAWATPGSDGLIWRALLAGPETSTLLWCEAPGGRVDSITDLAGAAGWDEREAHDLYGLEPAGHEPLRALAAHPEALEDWTIPVRGRGTHQVAVGPIHAGVIESGHFRFHVVGERILAMDPRLFYKHRGLERAAEGRSPEDALAFAQRACAACAVTNTVAFAHAVESARGLEPDRDLRVARTIALELERLWNHLHDIGAICAGVGFAPGTMAFAALKDRAQRVNEALTGHRFGMGSIAIGRGAFSVAAATADVTRAQLRELRADTAGAWRELEFAGPVQARLDGVGVLTHEDAVALGASGPAARASGGRLDARSQHPRLWYADFTPAALPDAPGDVAARLRIRAAELETTYDLLDDLLRAPVAAGATAGGGETGEIGAGLVESPRGATACAVELDGGRVRRLHLRTGSYANWPALAHATAGNLLPDFPLINKSFELCYACVDR